MKCPFLLACRIWYYCTRSSTREHRQCPRCRFSSNRTSQHWTCRWKDSILLDPRWMSTSQTSWHTFADRTESKLRRFDTSFGKLLAEAKSTCRLGKEGYWTWSGLRNFHQHCGWSSQSYIFNLILIQNLLVKQNQIGLPHFVRGQAKQCYAPVIGSIPLDLIVVPTLQAKRIVQTCKYNHPK